MPVSIFKELARRSTKSVGGLPASSTLAAEHSLEGSPLNARTHRATKNPAPSAGLSLPCPDALQGTSGRAQRISLRCIRPGQKPNRRSSLPCGQTTLRAIIYTTPAPCFWQAPFSLFVIPACLACPERSRRESRVFGTKGAESRDLLLICVHLWFQTDQRNAVDTCVASSRKVRKVPGETVCIAR